MRIKKVSQVAGLVGGVANEYSESTNDAYSCDYANEQLDNKYSKQDFYFVSKNVVNTQTSSQFGSLYGANVTVDISSLGLTNPPLVYASYTPNSEGYIAWASPFTALNSGISVMLFRWNNAALNGILNLIIIPQD